MIFLLADICVRYEIFLSLVMDMHIKLVHTFGNRLIVQAD